MPASVDPAVAPPPLGDNLMPRLARWCGCEDTPSRKAFIIVMDEAVSILLAISVQTRFVHISIAEHFSCFANGRSFFENSFRFLEEFDVIV